MSTEYRLAPEVKAPVPVTDAYAGLRYLVDHAKELGVDPQRIAIMGDSAGGGIVASLAHYIKLKGGPAVKKQILIYPMLDDRNLEVDSNLAPFATWTTNDNKTGKYHSIEAMIASIRRPICIIKSRRLGIYADRCLPLS